MRANSRPASLARSARALIRRLLPPALVLAAGATLAADDGVLLTIAAGRGPGEVTLAWTGSQPPYEVFRSRTASSVLNEANLLGRTAEQEWTDMPPAESILYYLVQPYPAPASCGDSRVDYDAGEECDDGNQAGNDGCDPACRIERPADCGDGILDPGGGEECDDGGLAGGDGCSAACQLEPVGAFCGDGALDPLERCDDGNVINGDGCSPTCNLEGTTSLFVGMPGVPGRVDGVGTGARVGGAGGMALDATYIYLADTTNHAIRRIEIATARVETLAGDGTAGYLDSPSGMEARFSSPEGIATDGSTLWVGDIGNRRIRAVSLVPPYAVTTVAGSGSAGVMDGAGTAASLDNPRGPTYYAGMIYFLEGAAHVLRRFDPGTAQVITLAGSPFMSGFVDGFGDAARFNSPRYMASDNSGILYISDTNGFAIRAFNTRSAEVTTFAGNGTSGYVDGTGSAALVNRPRGITADGSSVYWTEFSQHTVRQGVLASQAVTTLAGQHCSGAPCPGGYVEGVGTGARFNGPFAVLYHHGTGSLFVLDSQNFVIRQIR